MMFVVRKERKWSFNLRAHCTALRHTEIDRNAQVNLDLELAACVCIFSFPSFSSFLSYQSDGRRAPQSLSPLRRTQQQWNPSYRASSYRPRRDQAPSVSVFFPLPDDPSQPHRHQHSKSANTSTPPPPPTAPTPAPPARNPKKSPPKSKITSPSSNASPNACKPARHGCTKAPTSRPCRDTAPPAR